MTAVFTIGYQESISEAVVGTLAAAGVSLLVDIRAVAASRRPGFSKRQLAAGVATVGIDYLHLRGLGTPPDGRLAARGGRYADMRRIFEAHLATETATAEMDEPLAWSRRADIVPALFRAPCRPLPSPDCRRAAGRTARRQDRGPDAVTANTQRQNGLPISVRASSRDMPMSLKSASLNLASAVVGDAAPEPHPTSREQYATRTCRAVSVAWRAISSASSRVSPRPLPSTPGSHATMAS